MKKHLFFIAALALGMAACTNEVLTPEDNSENTTPEQAPSSSTTLQTATLSTFNSSPDRFVVVPQTRDDSPKPLELVAEITNPSTENRIQGFVKEGRYLSATSVFYDAREEVYYATYHMQGNNYNTTETDETSGFIETFKIDQKGTPSEGSIIMPADPSNLDFDFNHLYFDDLNSDVEAGDYSGEKETNTRLIAVGHKSEPSKKENGKPNTAAIIAKINLSENKIEYSTVLTGEQILDPINGTTSLGKEDAGDVNCVIRKHDWYYLATRKGLAILSANTDNLFAPLTNFDNDGAPIEKSVFFLRTPGSAKHIAHIKHSTSHFAFLYLNQPHPENYDGNYSLPANLISFGMTDMNGTLCGANSSDHQTIVNTQDFDITNWSLGINQHTISSVVQPIDGKNTIFSFSGKTYACLGKTGLYVRKTGSNIEGPYTDEKTITFSDKEGGSRPVNGVFVEEPENGFKGYLYVANGACLTILDPDNEEYPVVAEYSAYDEKDNEHLASANYVHVVRPDANSPERIITVAYGQEGVKVFKFTPPTR